MLGTDWTTSTRCAADRPQCVRVRRTPSGDVEVSDSKSPDGPTLRFTAGEWDAFVAGAKAGEFDLA